MIIKTENIEELAKQALTKPQDFGYWGNEDMFETWGFTGHDKSRDSRTIERSNFKVITNDLTERFPNDFAIEGFSHWAVGHVDRLVCRILIDKDSGCVESNITNAFKEAIVWYEKLDDYPIADEDDWYEENFKECIDTIENMADYLLLVIDRTEEDWAHNIYHQICQTMNVDFDPEFEQYPTDDQILEAALKANLCNPEKWGEWNEWCDEHNMPRPIWETKENPNQLKLFED